MIVVNFVENIQIFRSSFAYIQDRYILTMPKHT